MTRTKILIGIGILVVVCLILHKVTNWLESKFDLSEYYGEDRIIKDASGIERHVKVTSAEGVRRQRRMENLIYWLHYLLRAMLVGILCTSPWWFWIVLGWYIQSPW